MEPVVTSLPENFDGVFRFTNPTDKVFIGKWGGKSYSFQPMSTTPMVILDATPLEIQQIRKKFAKDLAVQRFFEGENYKKMIEMEKDKNSGAPRLNSLHMANTYSEKELETYIQECLRPLPSAKVSVADSPTVRIEEKLHKDDDGELVTQAIDKKLSLKDKAFKGEKI